MNIFKVGMSRKNVIVLVAISVAMTLASLIYIASSEYSSSPVVLQHNTTDAVPSYKKNKPLQCLSHRPNMTKPEWEQCLDPGKVPEYYLSIVIVTRMDNYAGNQWHRFQNFIDSAFLLAEKSEQKIELVIVEWNPPADKRRILDTFRFRKSKYLNHRIITVSNEIHKILPNKGDAPLHEFEGKNVGIRFARGEYVVCTNQDDIWSHNFMNAVKSRVFQKDTIYTQFQSPHDIHENFPPSIVSLPAFPDDATLYNACKLADQDWGNYKLPTPVSKSAINHDNYWYFADQAGDFTMAHRDTWKDCRGYREAGGVAWMDIEFILTAVGVFEKTLVYSGESFACHQEHPNEWEKKPERITSGQDAQGIDDIIAGKKKLVNQKGKWALLNIDIWEKGLECIDFQGGMCY
ncbi:unnamed protein product [Mucor hiemalis]